jgi:threonine dehydratase
MTRLPRRTETKSAATRGNHGPGVAWADALGVR